MIVSLDELKAVLGIDPAVTDEDDYLSRLIVAKTAWVENYTQRRFGTPILHEEIKRGSGEAHMYLAWKLDESEVTDPTPSPTDSVHVFRRPVAQRSLGWEELVEDVDWERSGQTLTFLPMWGVWPCEDEFLLQYLGGYTIPPEDVKEVILDMAAAQYINNQVVASDASSASSGVTSEKIGDFSYSIGSASSESMSSSAIGGVAGVSETAWKTLSRYKRRLA
jgi:hypothetical protein